MKPKRVAIVIGTRPEAIKMAPVYLTLKSQPSIEVILIVTAQHREMLDEVLHIFDIHPDVDLDLMKENQSLSDLSARLIVNVQKVLAQSKPDAVLVHGDTTTCLCSSLAAFYEQIPVGHVEAGLRTYDYNAPWPEEMNRRLTDPISRWCFAPTKRAADNLRAERVPDSMIHVTGNTVIDALFRMQKKIKDRYNFLIKGLPFDCIENKRLILVTGHRRESFGKPFEEFCFALRDITRTCKDVIIIYPVHLNPNVQKPVARILAEEEGVFLIEPVGYLSFLTLMERSEFIITDSGGIQEEAPTFHKPVLVTRATTERPEAVEMGLAKLVGTSRINIVSESLKLLTDRDAYISMTLGSNPYGDGKASDRIVDIMVSSL